MKVEAVPQEEQYNEQQDLYQHIKSQSDHNVNPEEVDHQVQFINQQQQEDYTDMDDADARQQEQMEQEGENNGCVGKMWANIDYQTQVMNENAVTQSPEVRNPKNYSNLPSCYTKRIIPAGKFTFKSEGISAIFGQ